MPMSLDARIALSAAEVAILSGEDGKARGAIEDARKLGATDEEIATSLARVELCLQQAREQIAGEDANTIESLREIVACLDVCNIDLDSLPALRMALDTARDILLRYDNAKMDSRPTARVRKYGTQLPPFGATITRMRTDVPHLDVVIVSSDAPDDPDPEWSVFLHNTAVGRYNGMFQGNALSAVKKASELSREVRTSE